MKVKRFKWPNLKNLNNLNKSTKNTQKQIQTDDSLS